LIEIQSQALDHAVGCGQQASATSATMTMVAVMGSMGFFGLHSPSFKWPEATTRNMGESVVNLMRRAPALQASTQPCLRQVIKSGLYRINPQSSTP